jgi:N6-adenosine-specific RNA methylase IME4
MTAARDSWEGLTPPYRTIVADRPWPYADAGNDHGAISRCIKRDGTLARGVAQMGYGVMSIDDLCALTVASIAARDAHLYLWTTNSFMEEAHRIVKAWGFTPKTILTWVKVHQDDPSRVSMKTGYYFRGATEHAIFAVRGSQPLLTDEGIPTAHLWPRIGTHSVKPAAFGDLVERCSPGPYVELFARNQRLGWDTWGYGWEGAA